MLTRVLRLRLRFNRKKGVVSTPERRKSTPRSVFADRHYTTLCVCKVSGKLTSPL